MSERRESAQRAAGQVPAAAVPSPRPASTDRPGTSPAPAPQSPYHAAVAAAWRLAAEQGPAALALVPPGTGTHAGAGTRAGSPGPVGPGGPMTVAEPGALLVRWANHALLELLALDHTEVVGRPLADLPADSASSWVGATRRLLRGTSTDVAATVHRADGVRRQVCVDLRPLGRGIDGWLVTLHPVTDEEQAARTALREAEHRFRALADHAPTGIFVSEAGVRLGYVNRRFADLLGADPQQLLGTRWLEAIHPQDVPKLSDTLQWVLGGETGEITVRLQPTGGVQRWLFLRLAPTTTPARAAGFIGSADDVTTRRHQEERLTYQARHDALTGLLNHARFTELLGEPLSSRRDRDRELALALVDVDHFRDVNDAYGRESGDRVLVELATRLRRTAREHDLVARLGGDTFALLLQGVRDRTQAEVAVRRQLDGLAAPLRVAAGEVRLTARAAVALPGGQDTPESLMRAAEALLDEASQDGSGAVRIGPAGA